MIGIVYISGCTSEEKSISETLVDFQNNQQSDSQITNSILKQSDIPRYELKKNKDFVVPKNCDLIYNGTNSLVDCQNERDYSETKKIGELLEWGSNLFYYIKYDSNENFPTRDSNENFIIFGYFPPIGFYNQSILEELKNRDYRIGIPNLLDYEYPNIGDYSLFMIEKIEQSYGSITYISTLMYTNKNYVVVVRVCGDEKNSRSEAFRIAELTENRLN